MFLNTKVFYVTFYLYLLFTLMYNPILQDCNKTYTIAYFAQNATLSYALVKIQESMDNKHWISPVSQTLIF